MGYTSMYGRMTRARIEAAFLFFFLSDGGVYLTHHRPTSYFSSSFNFAVISRPWDC